MRFFVVLLIWLSLTVSARATDPAPHILVDQFGYLPGLSKIAVIRDPVEGFDAGRSFRPGSRYVVIDRASGETVMNGSPVAWGDGTVDDTSGDRVWHFDFSAVQRPGEYIVRDINNDLESDPFEISPTVYRDVLRHAFKAFYYQRAGFEKRRPYVARGYEDSASHLGPRQDSEATRYNAVEDMSTARDLRGGWYDAGDYNQYTSWTANYISSLLASFIENPSVWTDEMGIPESGNGIPDVLDEVMWGLEWLERMQNDDGSMLSVLGRAEGSPPSAATGPSHYGLANTSATVTAAGTFAMAAEQFSKIPELSTRAARYRDRANRAWRWARQNPNIQFFNNSENHGTQGLAAGQQEVDSDRLRVKTLIAAMQLYGLTEDKSLLKEISRLYGEVGGITPYSPTGYEGDWTFAALNFASRPGVPDGLAGRIRSDYAAALNELTQMAVAEDDPYFALIESYWWGSNGIKSRKGSAYTQAIVGGLSDGEPVRLLDNAAGYLHYLHGVNPMGLVYLTNMERAGAERSVSTLYHAWFKDGSRLFDSTKTSRFGPAPGLMVGGPNPTYSRDDCCLSSCSAEADELCALPRSEPPSSQPPAKSYAEFNDTWPLNSWEVTENSLGYQSDYIRLLSKFVR